MTELSRRELLASVAAAGLGASLLAGAPSEGEAAAAGFEIAAARSPGRGMLRVSVPAPTTAVEPVTMLDPGSIALVQQVAEYLVLAGDGAALTPHLATSWKPDAKARVWTFSLRPGVFFSDGRAFRARDVARTFDRLVDPKSLSPAQTIFGGVLSPGGASVVDPLTVRFELERPYVDFPALVSSANYNAVILPADYDGHFEQRPIGTGPFRLVAYENGVKAAFIRNRSYWRSGLPLLDGVEMRFADLAAQVLAMKAGATDLMVLTPFEAARTLAADPGIRILRSRSNAWLGLHMRTDTAPWSDRRVRLALALSVDRSALLDVVQGGYGRLGNDDVFPPSFPLSSPPRQRARDIGRAQELLAEAGFGGGLDVTLTTINQGAPPQYAQLVQNQAAPAGFRIKLDLQPLAVYYGNGTNQPWRDVPFGLVGWTSAPTPALVAHETSTCGGVWNASRWCSKEFDRLARRFDGVAESAARQEIASRMAAIQHREVPLVVAYWIDALRATRKGVSGVRASGSGSVDLSRARLAGNQ